MSSSRHWKDDVDTLVASETDSVLQERERGALVRRTSSARGYDAETREEAIRELHFRCTEFDILCQAAQQACLSGQATEPWPAGLENSHTVIQNLQDDFGISWQTPLPAQDEDDDVRGNNDDNRLLLHSSGARRMGMINSVADQESSTGGCAETALVRRVSRSNRHAQGSRRSHEEYSDGSTEPHRGKDKASHGGRHRRHSPGGTYTNRGLSSRDFMGSEQSSAGSTTSSHLTPRLAPRLQKDSRYIKDPGSVIPSDSYSGSSHLKIAGDWALRRIDPNTGKVNIETGEERVGPSHYSSTYAAAGQAFDSEESLIGPPRQQEMPDDSDFYGEDFSSSGPSRQDHRNHESDKSERSHGSHRSHRSERTNGQDPYVHNWRPRPI